MPVVLLALVGASSALAGAYWDDAWHTDRGRDSFFIAPHFAIYSGITVAGAALTIALALALRRDGLSAVRRQRPLALAFLALVTTLGAAPIDNIWHVAFGRDAVIWSPPHVLGVVGSAGLGVALLAMLARDDGRLARILRPLAGGFVLAAVNFLVVEFESDVPQFPVVWYLPALATVSALALALVRLVGRERLAATEAAAAHLVFVAAVAGYLLLIGFDAPKLPLLVAPALVLDVFLRRPPVLRAAGYVLALYLVYVPTTDWLGSGIELKGTDVAIGLPIAVLATALVLAFVDTERRSIRGGLPATTVVTALLLLLLAAPAMAHDPGQGDPAGTMSLRAQVNGHVVRLKATYLDRPTCDDVRSPAVVARRAGTTRRAPMLASGCTYSGQVELEGRGRWFVYVELWRQGKRVESWLPVKLEAGQHVFAAPRRYAYYAEARSGGIFEVVGGVVIYGLAFAFLMAVVRLARQERAGRIAIEG